MIGPQRALELLFGRLAHGGKVTVDIGPGSAESS